LHEIPNVRGDTVLRIPPLTFQNRASYIWDGRTATLQMLHFIYFLTTISTEYFNPYPANVENKVSS